MAHVLGRHLATRPLAESSHSLNAQGFNEGNNYSSKDVAYCQRNDTLFATIMRWPAQSAFTFKSLGMASDYYSGKVKKIELIGYGEVEYVQTIDGLCVTIPSTKPNALAPVFQMTFEKNTDKVSLSEIIDAYEAKAKALLGEVSYNTGWYSKNGVLDFISAIEDAKQYVNETESNQKVVIEKLNAEYKKLNTSGRNQAGAPSEEGATDCTMLHLLEGSDFAASELGSRFGTPANWTVENYSVPRDDSSQGIRNGIDSYPDTTLSALACGRAKMLSHTHVIWPMRASIVSCILSRDAITLARRWKALTILPTMRLCMWLTILCLRKPSKVRL